MLPKIRPFYVAIPANHLTVSNMASFAETFTSES
jgi:hypothetical protein